MIKKVKRGAKINQNEIPPEIFVKKDESNKAAANTDKTADSQIKKTEFKAQVVANQETNVTATVPSVQQNEVKPDTASNTQTEKPVSNQLSPDYLLVLEEKKSLYKAAAVKAKSENDKPLTLMYLQAFKVCSF